MNNLQPHLKSKFHRPAVFSGMTSYHQVAERYAILRWVAVLGQLTTVLVVYYGMKVSIHIFPMMLTILITSLTNLVFHLITSLSVKKTEHQIFFRDWPWEYIIGLMMMLDLIVLTALLFYSGGLLNPFAIFYVVNICLAGVTLSTRLNGIIINLAILCCIFLVKFYHDVPELTRGLLIDGKATGAFQLVQNGLLMAICTCIIVIGYFTTLVSSTLRKRDAELREVEKLRARGDKLEALGTLAAGAAHELSTPLATIAIVSKELDRSWQKTGADPQALQDIKDIRREVERCRAILTRMSAKAGLETVEATTEFTARKLQDEIMQGIIEHTRVSWNHFSEDDQTRMNGPLILLSQALRGIIQNAIEASSAKTNVNCQTQITTDQKTRKFIEISISDQGEGMPPEILERVGEPFFTTKPTGKGMGLGLFLCRSVVERLGGTLRLDSAKNQGTTVVVELPLNR